MRLLRRSTAFVMSLLLIQLSLVGGNASCESGGPGGVHDAVVSSGSHAAMVMGHDGSMSTSAERPSPGSTSHEGCATMPPASDCSMPVSCAAPSLPAGVVVALEINPLDTDGWADPALAQPAPPAAPELPPPRA